MHISGITTFSGNSASDDGGVCARYGSNVDVTGVTTFSGNLAGGIMVEESMRSTVAM